MAKFISVNAKYYTKKELYKRHFHNTREAFINYLLPADEIKFKNLEYSFGEKNMVRSFLNLDKKKTEVQKKKGFYKKNGNDLIEMVVALSEEQALNYLNTQNGEDKILEGLKQFADDIKQQYGFEPISIFLHTDEGYINPMGEVKYNIHAHVDFLNFDFKKEKTVLRNLRKKDWGDIQDLAQVSFQKKDLDFIRGTKKLDNTKDHLNRNDYISYKQEREINQNNSTLNKYQNELNNIIEEINPLKIELENLLVQYKQEYTSLNALKNTIKEQRAIYDRTSTEYQNLTIKFKDTQKQEQASRNEFRNLSLELEKIKENINKGNNYIKLQEDKIKSLNPSEIEKRNKEIYIHNLKLKNDEINILKNQLESQIKEKIYYKDNYIKLMEEKEFNKNINS